jgi:hypothetical protein
VLPGGRILQKTQLIVILFTSLIIASVIAIPNFRIPRSVPGSHCHSQGSLLTSKIHEYNWNMLDKKESAPGGIIKIFTESPENLQILQSSGIIDMTMLHSTSSVCNYGTVGDFSDDGFIVCEYHGTVRDDEGLDRRDAVFYGKRQGQFVVNGVLTRSKWYTKLGRITMFTGIKVFVITFILAVALQHVGLMIIHKLIKKLRH